MAKATKAANSRETLQRVPSQSAHGLMRPMRSDARSQRTVYLLDGPSWHECCKTCGQVLQLACYRVQDNLSFIHEQLLLESPKSLLVPVLF